MAQVTMRDCIVMTPALLRDQAQRAGELTAPLVADLGARPWRRVLLVASGSSFTACTCVQPYLEGVLGVPVAVVHPFTFARYTAARLTADDFAVVVSQTGASTNCLDALAATRAQGLPARVLTTIPTSDCAQAADRVYNWGCGPEAVDYVTFGPMTLIAYLLRVGAQVAEARGLSGAVAACNEQLEQAAAAHAEVLRCTDAFIKRVYQQLMQMSRVYVLGCGCNFGTALEGALKVGETVKVLAVGYEQDEFLHGPALQLAPTYSAFVIDGGDVTTEHARHVHEGLTRVTPNAYLIKPAALMSDAERADPRVLGLPMACPEPYTCLYTLPVFQVIAATLSADLACLPAHPLYYEMNKVIDFRTAAYRTDHPARDPA